MMTIAPEWLDSRVDFSCGGAASTRKKFAQVRQNAAHFGAFHGSPRSAPKCAIFWRKCSHIGALRAALDGRKSSGVFRPATVDAHVDSRSSPGGRGRDTQSETPRPIRRLDGPCTMGYDCRELSSAMNVAERRRVLL